MPILLPNLESQEEKNESYYYLLPPKEIVYDLPVIFRGPVVFEVPVVFQGPVTFAQDQSPEQGTDSSADRKCQCGRR